MENIYDITYYGVFATFKYENVLIRLYKNKSDIRPVKGYNNSIFTVKLLPEYKGKENVLKISFDKLIVYETLYDPGFCLYNGAWDETEFREIPKAFLKLTKKEKNHGHI